MSNLSERLEYLATSIAENSKHILALTRRFNLLESFVHAPDIKTDEKVLVWNADTPDDKIEAYACGSVDEYGNIEVFDDGSKSTDDVGIISYNMFGVVDPD